MPLYGVYENETTNLHVVISFVNSPFIHDILYMLLDALLVEPWWFKTAGPFQCRQQVVKFFVAAGSFLKTGRSFPGHFSKAALLTAFLLKIN